MSDNTQDTPQQGNNNQGQQGQQASPPPPPPNQGNPLPVNPPFNPNINTVITRNNPPPQITTVQRPEITRENPSIEQK